MSTGEGRKVSCHDIQLVQNHIEQCLREYMSQKDVVNTLYVRDNIEPRFTQLVWQKLEEENQEFFKAYYLKLLVKEQILEFNRLLAEQVKVMHRIGDTGIASMPVSNGSHYASKTTGLALKAEDMLKPIVTSLPEDLRNPGSSSFNPGSSSFNPSSTSCMHAAINVPTNARNVDVTPSMLVQRSNIGLPQGMAGRLLKPEAAYTSGSLFEFGVSSNFLEPHPSVTPVGDVTVSSFSSVESNTQPLSETLLDADTTSIGYFGQLSPNFGLPDFTPDFSNNSEIMGNYSRSPFPAADSNDLLNCNGSIDRLASSSEGLRYKAFGGD